MGLSSLKHDDKDIDITKKPFINIHKFSTICSNSFNVSQTQWSDDSADEDITDGLLNIGKSFDQILHNPNFNAPERELPDMREDNTANTAIEETNNCGTMQARKSKSVEAEEYFEK